MKIREKNTRIVDALKGKTIHFIEKNVSTDISISKIFFTDGSSIEFEPRTIVDNIILNGGDAYFSH